MRKQLVHFLALVNSNWFNKCMCNMPIQFT